MVLIPRLLPTCGLRKGSDVAGGQLVGIRWRKVLGGGELKFWGLFFFYFAYMSINKFVSICIYFPIDLVFFSSFNLFLYLYFMLILSLFSPPGYSSASRE